MKTYLFSPIEASLVVDKEYFSLTENNPAIINEQFQSLKFIFGNVFENSTYFPNQPHTSQNVKIFDFFDGKIIIPKLRKKRNLPYKKLFSQNQNLFGQEINISIVCDGAIKLVLSGQYYHEETELPFQPREWKIVPHSSKPLAIIILKDKLTAAICFSLPELKTIFQTVCDELSFGEYLSVTTYKRDILKHIVTDIWDVNEKFTLQGRKVTSNKKNITNDLIPLVFLQEIAIGGDYRNYLAESLLEKAELIPDFIGSFSHIIVPIASGFENTYSLVSDSIKYFTATVENDKIIDFTIE